MRRRDRESAHTDQITRITKDPYLLAREIGDLPAVLQVLCVAEGDDAVDAVFYAGWEVFDRAVAEGCALTWR
jgi:hypothetical protein